VGLRIPGPAIIEGMDSTIWAPSTSEIVVGSGGDLSLLLSTTRVSENVGVV
jgi:hypothetical protein